MGTLCLIWICFIDCFDLGFFDLICLFCCMLFNIDFIWLIVDVCTDLLFLMFTIRVCDLFDLCYLLDCLAS